MRCYIDCALDETEEELHLPFALLSRSGWKAGCKEKGTSRLEVGEGESKAHGPLSWDGQCGMAGF